MQSLANWLCLRWRRRLLRTLPHNQPRQCGGDRQSAWHLRRPHLFPTPSLSLSPSQPTSFSCYYYSLDIPHSLTLSLPLALSPTHKDTHTLTHAVSHTHTLSLTLSLSLSLQTRPRTVALMLRLHQQISALPPPCFSQLPV